MPGQTLQLTALVHEAYLRIVGDGQPNDWNSRGHFFAAAAEAMRRILINRARDKQRLKRGGDRARVQFELLNDPTTAPDDHLLELDEALSSLADTNPQAVTSRRWLHRRLIQLPDWVLRTNTFANKLSTTW